MTHDDISRLFALLAELQELDPRVAARVLQNVLQTLQGERQECPPTT